MSSHFPAIASTVALLIAGNAIAQEYEYPLTEWGVPNLQGNWKNHTVMPFERPRELGRKQAYTEAEAQ